MIKFKKYIKKCSGKAYQPLLILLAIFLFIGKLSAQENKTAVMKFSFNLVDSAKTCTVKVLTDSSPVKEIEVHLYAKRMYSLLPLGSAVSTDENGEAVFNLPNDLPGDKNLNLDLVARIEKNEIFGTVQTESQIVWKVLPGKEEWKWSNRSLSASREKAPMYLVIVSSMIILLIWGTILYIFYQLIRIKKSGRAKKIIIAPL